ncbi:response regulator transcription factor [Micromonospora zingiberis]|uniref:Response regulator transcription factor n=1 Tax=Micromonospora zingiberis TaxID=2053011 RepID=A0A4R0GHG4_9ACTN|nr:response regulator transcription factor [Micromonospora zingiberis]TCB96800.1 response regulator transcription factor [Micromonospora zingiberis]
MGVAISDASGPPNRHNLVPTDGEVELVTVLIVHPRPVERAALRAVLHADDRIRVVALTGDGDRAVDLARRLRPAVTLLDDHLAAPGDGELVRALARESRVLMLTAATERRAITALLRAPVRGCLVYGQFDAADLHGAVCAVAAGLGWLSPVAVAAASWELRSGRAAAATQRS